MVDFDFCVTQEKGSDVFSMAELKSRFSLPSKLNEGVVSFRCSFEKAVEVCYSAQSIKRVLLKVDSGRFEDFEDFLNKSSESLKSFPFDVVNFSSFRVVCERTGEHDFNSMDVEQELSRLVKDFSQKVIDLSSPDVSFFVEIIDDAFVFGLDFGGRDLSKRQYLLFNNPNNLKGTLGFDLLLFADYKKDDVLLDPFSLAGTICIEAATFSSDLPINFYTKKFGFSKGVFNSDFSSVLKKLDSKASSVSSPIIFSCDPSFNNVSAQKKNAKIGGVEKFISFSRKNVEDLDLKFFEKDIDLIASKIIEPSKSVPEHVCESVYSHLLDNSKVILAKSGRMAFILRNPDLFIKLAKSHGFVLRKDHVVWQGKQEFHFCLFERKK